MFKTPIAATFALALVATAGHASETFVFDKGHTEVLFSWNHAGLSTQTAEFTTVDGTVTIDRENIGASVVDVVIATDSIHTGFDVFDEHMVGGEWFDAAQFPDITFKSTAVRQVSVDEALIDGELTIKGITKPVTLHTKLLFDGEHPLGQFNENYKKPYTAFEARTTVLRSDWGLGAYAPLTSDTVEIVINAEMELEPQA